MKKCKFVLELKDGTRVWLNMYQMVKMIKTRDDQYFLYMSNGEVFPITYREAKKVEELLES